MKKMPMLAIVLAIAIGIIVIANVLSNKQPAEQSLLFFPQFTAESCGKLVISDAQGSVTIAHKNARWVVADAKPTPDYAADSGEIQIAIDKIKNLKKEELISQNVKKQADYEVDSAHGICVEVYSDKNALLGSVYIGKNGSDWNTNFVRSNKSSDVYLASGSIKYAFFTDKSRWKDKTILKVEKTFVKEINLVKKDTAIQLVKIAPNPKDSTAKSGWQMTSPLKDTVNQSVVNTLLDNVVKFNTTDFEENTALTDDSLGFTNPSLTVTASLENGDKKSLIFGKDKNSGKRWVRTSGNPTTFIVDKYLFDNVNKTVNALRGIEEKKPAVKAAHAPGKKKVGKK